MRLRRFAINNCHLASFNSCAVVVHKVRKKYARSTQYGVRSTINNLSFGFVQFVVTFYFFKRVNFVFVVKSGRKSVYVFSFYNIGNFAAVFFPLLERLCTFSSL